MEEDAYKTIVGETRATYRDKSSKFIAIAKHVETEEEIRGMLSELRKSYYDATHHCYAWRLGAAGEVFRSNDDGEPSGTAGKPILGQLLSRSLTYSIVVVVRYFGGTKLGVPGLISAYKEAASEVLNSAPVEIRTEDASYEVRFGYSAMNDVMKAVKEEQPRILEQELDNACRMVVAVRRSAEERLIRKLESIGGVTLDFICYK